MDVNIYLSFDGRCAEAFDFYARVLGGTIEIEAYLGRDAAGGRHAARLPGQDHARASCASGTS